MRVDICTILHTYLSIGSIISLFSIVLVTISTITLYECQVTVVSAFQVTQVKRARQTLQTRVPVILSMTMSPTNDVTTTEPKTKTNINKPLPLLPIPEPICSNIVGTWAYDTMNRRINNEILERTAKDCVNDLQLQSFQHINQNFQLLRNELSTAATSTLTHLHKPYDYDTNFERQKEYDEWYTILNPYILNNDTWLTAPWLITEFYLYRRLMDVFHYWTPNTVGYKYDPFSQSKRTGLYSSIGSAEPMLGKIPNLPSDSPSALSIVTNIALWGNKMDLSLWPADVTVTDTDIFSEILDMATDNLLHDDSKVLFEHCTKLRQNGGGNIDIVIDNAGFELVTDLALGQYLIQSGIAKVVTFQLKSHPTFVSDALEKDLVETVQYYTNLDPIKYPNCVAAGTIWTKLLQTGQWQCKENNFWVQPYPMWDMTEPLRSDLHERCQLAFIKGDANYRRLLGDCKWDYSIPSFQSVVGTYFPCPVCALRTLKAEVCIGIDPEQVIRASSIDTNWMTTGQFGVIHFGTGSSY